MQKEAFLPLFMMPFVQRGRTDSFVTRKISNRLIQRRHHLFDDGLFGFVWIVHRGPLVALLSGQNRKFFTHHLDAEP
jgi:hypothetical protein